MEILGRPMSHRLDDVHLEAERTLGPKGKTLAFKDISEHPNQTFRHLRGAQASVPGDASVMGIYLNARLDNREFELVAVHELCHIIVKSEGFGYAYGLTRRVPEDQADHVENVAVTLGQCFPHLSVYRKTQEHGYSIDDFDAPLLDEIRSHIARRSRLGNIAVGQNVGTHVSNVYQESLSLATLDLQELEALYDVLDPRILEVSRRVQSAIAEVRVFSVRDCYLGTLSLRRALGAELGVDLDEMMHFVDPESGIPH